MFEVQRTLIKVNGIDKPFFRSKIMNIRKARKLRNGDQVFFKNADGELQLGYVSGNPYRNVSRNPSSLSLG